MKFLLLTHNLMLLAHNLLLLAHNLLLLSLRSNFGPYTFIKGQRDKGTEGQRDKGTKGQRNFGTWELGKLGN